MGSVSRAIALAWVAPNRKLAILVATNIGPKAKAACNEVKDALLKARDASHVAVEPEPATDEEAGNDE
jgi:hypothetical protein